MFSSSASKYQSSPARYERPMDDMTCIIESGSHGSVYLGNFDSAQSVENLRKHRIGAVLSICMTKLPYSVTQQLQHYQHIYLEDSETENIQRFFDQSNQFIEKARQSTNVLVHCQAGISRSASLVVAYMMKKDKLSAKDALAIAERKRWQVYPNNGFIRQLNNYEKSLNLAVLDNSPGRRGMTHSGDYSSTIKSSYYQTPTRYDHKYTPSSGILQSPEYQRIRNKYIKDEQSDIKSRPLDLTLDFRRRNTQEDWIKTTPEPPRKALFTETYHTKQNDSKNFNQMRQQLLDQFTAPIINTSHTKQKMDGLDTNVLDKYHRDFLTRRQEFENRYNHSSTKPLSYLKPTNEIMGNGYTANKLDQLLQSTSKPYRNY